MATNLPDSEFLNYILGQGLQAGDQLPPLNEISDALQINVGKLREQLEVARSLGLVEVRPRTGVRIKAYDFLPAIRLSLLFGLAQNPHYFQHYTALRNHLEMSFWHEAVSQLMAEDYEDLQRLIESATRKLTPPLIQIPHAEHRQFHLRIFAHVGNPFVISLLEAYWDAYEAVEYNTYADLHYWQEAWAYHEKILNHLIQNNPDAALQAFIEHTRLLRHRLDGTNTTALRPTPSK